MNFLLLYSAFSIGIPVVRSHTFLADYILLDRVFITSREHLLHYIPSLRNANFECISKCPHYTRYANACVEY